MLRTWFTGVAALVVATITLAGEARSHGPSDSPEATLATQPEAPLAGERATLTFTLTDGSGEPVRDLTTHHGRKLHVVVVSEDMQVLGHVHPYDFGEPIKDGSAQVFFTFPRPGRYLVAAGYMTAEGAHAEQFTLEVAAADDAASPEAVAAAPPSQAVVTLEEDDRYTDPVLLQGNSEANGYSVSLQRPDKVEAGEPVTFTYRFSKDGAPVTDLRPYLDAPLHLAVVSQDLMPFLHEHGTLPRAGYAGHDEGAEHHAHGSDGHDQASGHHAHHGYQGPATFGPEITASFTFPAPGRYYLFSQAAHGERLLISRIPVDVH